MKNSTLLALAMAAAIAGCGGGGGGGDSGAAAPAASTTPAATAQVPASASMSVDGFVSYLMALFTSDADTLEPVDVSAVTPQTSDEAPPTTVD